MIGIRFTLGRGCITVAALAMVVVLGRGCDFGSTEGDRCNALIVHDECNSGLHCTQVSCAATYCCPDNGQSSNANCQNIVGCPDEAGADEAGTEAGEEAGAEAGTEDAGFDATDQ